MSSKGMRGLTNFIKEVRDCPDKETEKQRVMLELAKFKQVFGSNMGSYQRKKYVCKLLYIFMLGYRVELGRREAILLCGAKKFAEKQVGYLAVGVLLHDGHDLMEQLIEVLNHDIDSSNFEIQALAVTAIANIGGRVLAQRFGDKIINIMMSQNSTTQLKKKASICLLRIMRQNPDILKPEFMMLKIQQLLGMYHLGLLTSVMSLLQGLVKLGEPSQYQQFLPRVIDVLYSMVVDYKQTQTTKHYEYFGVPNPWLQIKLIGFLNHFPIPTDEFQREKWEAIVKKLLHEQKISTPDETSRTLTAKNAVLMEVFGLVVKMDTPIELKRSMFILSEFMSSNSKCLGKIACHRLHFMLQATSGMIQFAAPHYKKIFSIIDLPCCDRTTKIKIVEIMFVLCSSNMTNEIVQVLLQHLSKNDPHVNSVICERLLILAERAIDSSAQWYVEIVIRLLAICGSYVPESNVQRFIQVVLGDQNLHEFASIMITKFGCDVKTAPSDSFTLTSSLILRSCGAIVADKEGSSPIEQFKCVALDFSGRSPIARSEAIVTLFKFKEVYPSLEDTLNQFFESYGIDVNDKPDSTFLSNSIPRRSVPAVPKEDEPPTVSPHHIHQNAIDLSKAPPSEPDEYYISLEPRPVPPVRSVPHAPEQHAVEIHERTTPPSEHPEHGSLAVYHFPETSAYRSLLLSTQAVLYQSETLQIGFIKETKGSSMKLTLYYGNLTSSPLNHIDVSVNNPDMNALIFNADAPPIQLDPKQQKPQVVNIECVNEFDGAPVLNISYEYNGETKQVNVHLPFICTSFVSQYSVSSQDFLLAWNQINGLPLETQAIWKTTSLDKTRVQKAFTTLGFSSIEGVDGSPQNLVVTALFAKRDQQIPVLCRLEADPATHMYRITTKCFSDILSSAISNQIKFVIH